ncbi:OmpA family protein [Hymenobacter sp. BT683]|uniref:OmpA family protein n=1 Tax=Hymenobacter jeongseonensis TaxID=2791027 RepID=A0ABS0IBQ3_9BACT|nr:OmpA family protein [Hymenobacter jeongseonensis]MBF9235785.1 OmpA family protein [Hymenobacter jeongseonensis]
MKAFLTLVFLLFVFPAVLHAQPETAGAPVVYADASGRYQLAYPRSWQLRKRGDGTEATFYPGTPSPAASAIVTLTSQVLSEQLKDLKLTAYGGLDSMWRRIQRMPRAQVLGLEQQDFGSYEEVRYEYSYLPGPPAAARTHVVGRRIWRGGYQFQIEYRGEIQEDGRYFAEGKQLVGSFAFTEKSWPSRRYAAQMCDDKLYGIAAIRYHNGNWEDDCRTIHEFANNDLTDAPVVHRQALPFQSYALAKGFDNCLYSVTKAPTDAPELVYRYDPATRKGAYTAWRLPPQGPDNVWISAATDDKGDLFFMTSDANRLIKVSPATGVVTPIWYVDPIQKAPFYPTIAFSGAGTHGNFCLDDANTMYLVYSTDGSLLKIDLKTQRPTPEMMPLGGLPKKGGYSDLLMQNDRAGRRRLYLAGPKSVYKVDLARKRATLVRKGTYTDLAGCNLFRIVPRPAPAPPPPTTALWRGRVLNAATYQPLPQAQLRLGLSGFGKVVRLSPEGAFSYAAKPGVTHSYRAQLTGYIAADSTWMAAPGSLVRDILLQPLAVGATVQLDNVQFEQGQAVLLPTSFSALDKLVSLMTENPRMTIELRGHTDNVGPPEKNVVLSEQRVGTVKEYLVGHGIGEARISGIGLGGAQPAASNDQEYTRKLNRRVEFRITGLQ